MLPLGNVVPACQRCNDSRGNGDWRQYLQDQFPENCKERASAVEQYLARHPYEAVHPEAILSLEELEEYQGILESWDVILEEAKDLYSKVNERRGIK